MSTQTAEREWIVEQACGHVSVWRYAGDREDFAALPSTPQNVPCKGAPVVGWGEWCDQCRDIVPIARVAAAHQLGKLAGLGWDVSALLIDHLVSQHNIEETDRG